MAKQSVNIIERHAEKAVLGVCGAALLAAIALYLVSSPNKTDMDGEMVKPDMIDKKIVDAGRSLSERLRNIRPEEEQIEDALPKLTQASDPYDYAGLPVELPAMVPFLPPVPEVAAPVPMAGELRLATVLPPEKPVATHGRATADLKPAALLGPKASRGGGAEPTAGPQLPTDVNWVTVAALYDWQQQINMNKSAGYKRGRRNPYLAGVELQRRERRPDGTFSAWVDVTPYMPLVAPEQPTVNVIRGRKDQPVVDETTRERVGEYFKILRENQLELYRPMFPEVVKSEDGTPYGDEWTVAEFPDLDIPTLDKELDPESQRTYPWRHKETSEPERPKTPEELLAEAEDFLKDRYWKEAEKLAEQVLKLEGIPIDLKRRAISIQDQAAQIRTNVELGREPDPYKDASDDEPEEKRPTSRYQVVWAHDAAPGAAGGAVSGRTYQYRLRLKTYNRYCASPGDLADSGDAEKILLLSEWSEPTEDVYIPPDTQFFLTSGNPFTKSGAKVTVFKWFEGVWVSHAFPIEVGQPIGSSARETVRILDGRPDRPWIDFYTGATAVDIDYDYAFRPKKRRGREGFIIESRRQTVALVFGDEQGRLDQRILAADKASAEYRDFRERVFDPRGVGGP